MSPKIQPEVRVAVCGGSLHMAGLAASLRTSPDVAVLRILASTADLAQALEDFTPGVIAFDVGEMPGDLAISLVRDSPGLTLIGVDPSNGRMLLLSARQEQPVSAAELVQVLTGQEVASEVDNRYLNMRRLHRRQEPTNTKETDTMETEKGINEVVNKALLDPAFRGQLIEDPVQAAASIGVTLTEEQAAVLKGADLSKLAEGVDERLSKFALRM